MDFNLHNVIIVIAHSHMDYTKRVLVQMLGLTQLHEQTMDQFFYFLLSLQKR